ncbi:hypothetical protein EC991_006184 [Linnemannia zychae]|nr:hypothetical protein EC991_006184 [Linnemannia zychae]
MHSKPNNPLTQILVLYHKATSTFLLRQLAAAYSTSLEAIELLARTNTDYGLDHSDNVNTQRSFYVLKQKLWILHSTIYGAMLTDRAAALATSGNLGAKTAAAGGLLNGVRSRVSGSSSKDTPEKLVKDLWKRLVDDYAGFEGDVDGQVMVPFVMLCVQQKLYTLARQIVEAYLATIPEGMLIHLETAAGVSLNPEGPKDPLMTNYERLVELYLIHVLAKLGEWTSATDFLQFNTVLSDASKKSYSKILDKLHQKSLRPKKQKTSLPTLADSRSSNTSASPSISSTSVSSPTLSSASTMGSPATSHTLEPRSNGSSPAQSSNNSNTTAMATTVTKKATSTVVASSGRSKVAVGKKGSATTVQATKTQGRLMILLQHYVDQIKNMSSQMGANQLMIIVGLVVFMGVLSRNRTKASRYLKAAANKVMQTVKMGTTVTSI